MAIPTLGGTLISAPVVIPVGESMVAAGTLLMASSVKDYMDSEKHGKKVTNSAGQQVQRRYVNNQEELLNAAEEAAGGSLDDFNNYKEYWWESPDGSRRIEWNPDGHANTNEGPHVTVRDFNGKRHSVTEKIFIEGWDKFYGN